MKVRDIVKSKVNKRTEVNEKIGLVKKTIFVNNVLVCSKIKLGNNMLLERPTQILYPLKIYSDVMNNEDKSFTRNKNETYET